MTYDLMKDGNVEQEYTPDFMRYRCEQMGVKTVPVFWKGTIPENPASADDPTIEPGEWIKNVAERFYDGLTLWQDSYPRGCCKESISLSSVLTSIRTGTSTLEGIVKVEAERLMEEG